MTVRVVTILHTVRALCGAVIINIIYTTVLNTPDGYHGWIQASIPDCYDGYLGTSIPDSYDGNIGTTIYECCNGFLRTCIRVSCNGCVGSPITDQYIDYKGVLNLIGVMAIQRPP
jgi:hypothetical protein